MSLIRFTNHAIAKIEILKNHGFSVDTDLINECLTAPAKIDTGRGERKIAQMVYDEDHVLRVIYEERENGIMVITVYPGRRTRYENDSV